ncbi:NAD(P)-dependent dehydrogenase (short-subunit alcohol dehydrogenase family) [Luteibacter sp. 621]|uniref:SDR family NAD(P)-dependent oxidoreductase n=1 Tax=Luteibacter sp. 621 TaxID=3373916 RepID=UPI003D26338B
MPQSPPTPRRALIIGASRGLGLGLTARFLERGWSIVATEREGRPSKGLGALLVAEVPLSIEQVDIDDEAQILSLRTRLAGERFGLVFVNAGILSDPALPYAEQVLQVMRTNVAGAMRAVEVFSDLVVRDGALAVMSSGLGSISGNVMGGWEPYRSSKAALNQSLRSFAAEHPDMGYALSAVAPGWVRTEMGGPDAALDVETSTSGIAKVIEGRLGDRGLRFVNHQGADVVW